jgi:hypothetical protein
VDEKTARTQVRKYVLAIQGLKAQKVNASWLSCRPCNTHSHTF